MEERKDNPEVLRDGKPVSLDEGSCDSFVVVSVWIHCMNNDPL